MVPSRRRALPWRRRGAAFRGGSDPRIGFFFKDGHEIRAFVLYGVPRGDVFGERKQAFTTAFFGKLNIEGFMAFVAERLRDFEADQLIFPVDVRFFPSPRKFGEVGFLKGGLFGFRGHYIHYTAMRLRES